MVTVKNHRVLHGRSELVGGVSGAGRHLQCGYMDWDEIRSTIRLVWLCDVMPPEKLTLFHSHEFD